MIGIGIIGAGFMAGQHALSAQAAEGVRLVATAATHREQAADFARRFSIVHEPTVGSLLARDDIDAVIVATPTDTHSALTVQALNAGRHVLVEKPMARTLEQARVMRDAAERTARVLGVGHVIRYLDEFRALGEAIDRGDIGRPAVATLGRRCQTPQWTADGWLLDDDRSGGVLLDMMIHDIDLVRWWFGEPDRGFARRVGPGSHAGLDYALSTLSVPSGPICHLHAHWCEPDGFSHGAEIAGSAGLLHWDMSWSDGLRFAPHEGDGRPVSALPPPDPGPHDPWVRQLADFVAAIEGERSFPGDGAWGYRSLEIALALLDSADRLAPVDLATGDRALPPAREEVRA